MTLTLQMLAWTLVLAVAQILIASAAKRRQDGFAWAAGSRDEVKPPYTGIAGRLQRAQANLFETLPIFAAAVLIAHAAGREGALAAWGVQLYFWGRLVYVPLYASGIPMVRSIAWCVSFAGLVLVLAAIL